MQNPTSVATKNFVGYNKYRTNLLGDHDRANARSARGDPKAFIVEGMVNRLHRTDRRSRG